MKFPVITKLEDGDKIVSMSPVYKYNADSDQDFKEQIIEVALKNAEHYAECLENYVDTNQVEKSIVIQLKAIINYYLSTARTAEENLC
jgi:hypothetical protein